MKTETNKKRRHERIEQNDQAEWEAARIATVTASAIKPPAAATSDEAEWTAAIQRAKVDRFVAALTPRTPGTPPPLPPSLPPPFPPADRARPSFDLRAWEERIDRATRRPTPAVAPTAIADGRSIRARLERLAVRASEVQEAREEEELWQAAIRQAKTGNS